MSAHAKLSPSSAERWMSCPGSINLIATLPETAFKSSRFAAEGSVAHSLAEDFMRGEIDFLSLTSLIGTTRMHENFEIEITDAMVEGIMEYVDAIAQMRKRLTKRQMPVEGKAEVRVTAYSVSEEVYGTADYILYQRGHELHVFDFKYGKGVVQAEENVQGLIYLMAAADTEAGNAFDKAFFHIVQPRAAVAGETFRTWELPQGRLQQFQEELRAAVAATKDPNAKRVAGTWCKFCPALAYCPEAAGAVQAVAQTVFTKLPPPPSKEMGAAFLPPVSSLTVDQVAKALDWEDAIDSWFEAIRTRAQEELARDANSIPGYKLVEGKTNRAWASEEAAETAFALLGEKRYAPRKLLSPAQMEKIAGKEQVAPLVVKPAGKPTVAKSTDKRQAMGGGQSAVGVFDVVPPVEDNIFGDLMGPAVKEVKPIWP